MQRAPKREAIARRIWPALHGGKFDIALLERLTAEGCDLEAVNPSGFTPLWSAVSNNDIRAARWLLVHGADPNHRLDDRTILHSMATSDDAEDVRLLDELVRRGADVNAATAQGVTPLLVAVNMNSCTQSPKCDCEDDVMSHPSCWSGAPHMVRALLAQGADPNRADVYGTRPLFRVAAYSHLDEVVALIGAGARPTGLDGNGQSIWDAMTNPDPRMVAYLLAHGASADEADGSGERPLHALAYHLNLTPRWGNEQQLLGVARLLIARGARVDAVNDEGQTPMHLAGQYGFASLAKLLLEDGATRFRRKTGGSGRCGCSWAAARACPRPTTMDAIRSSTR